VLRELDFLLPTEGHALDLACGRGGNALWLAARGLRVSAWDYAPAAIEALRRQAEARGLIIDAQVRDVCAEPPSPEGYDVIVVSYFLARELAPAIAAALRPGGLLFYETFVQEAVSDRGPGNPAFRLAPNELLALFPGLLVLDYREHARVGDQTRGQRDIATLVSQRRP
jgi:SAM-dependent methyltransferase